MKAKNQKINGKSFKDGLYFNEISSRRRTSKTPSNLISIPDLIRNLPYWIAPASIKKKKPKTLIVNLSNWNELNANQKLIYEESLRVLKTKGFKIYYYAQNGQIRLYKDESNEFKDMDSLPSQSDLLIKAKAEHDLELEGDKLRVLNLSEYELVIQCSLNDLSQVDSKTALDLKGSNLNLSNLKQALSKSGENIETIVLKGCTNLNGEWGVEHLTLPKLNSLDLGKNTDSESVHLTTHLPIPLHPTTLNAFLKAAPNLKKLNLSGLAKESFSQFPEEINLPLLEDLCLGKEVTPAQANRFLVQAKRIKKLKMSKCTAENSFDKLQSSHLEILELSGGELNSRQLGQLFSNPENLLTLHLENVSIQDYPEKMNFAKLENFNVEVNTSINMQFLQGILKGAPKLKKLNLLLTESVSLTDIRLNELEELSIMSGDDRIEATDLMSLLKNAPKLKVLRLGQVNNIAALHLDDVKLNHLEELEIDESNISTEVLEQILKHAPRIKKLKLRSCTNLREKPSSALNFDSLNVINFECSELHPLWVNQFLAKPEGLIDVDRIPAEFFKSNPLITFPNLQSFTLIHVDAKTDLDAILSPMNQLTKLYLDCSELGIISKDLIKLPKLKKLHLNSPSIQQIDVFDLNNMHNLETLYIRSKKIKAKDLILLANKLKPCKNLKTINFALCSFERGPETDAALEYFVQNCRFELLYLMDSLKTREDNFKEHLRTLIRSDQRIDFSSGHRELSIKKNANGKFLDADTDPGADESYKLNKIFYAKPPIIDPSPIHYRTEVYAHAEVNSQPCSIEHAFSFENRDDIDLIECSIPRAEHDLYDTLKSVPKGARQYYGKQSMLLSEEWQPLASLSANEKMLAYHLEYADDAESVEIAYSKRDNLHYIRKKKGHQLSAKVIDIDFVLEVPHTTKQDWPAEINEKIRQCRHFGEKKLKDVKDQATGFDYLNALNEQQVGACRHRSFVFKHWMDANYTYPTRIVESECHSFAEVFYNSEWVTVDLGGYPAKLEMNEPNLPNSLATYFPIPHAPKKIDEPLVYIQSLVSNKRKKELVQLKSAEQLSGLRYQIQEYCAKSSAPCFYIHSAEDLICSAAFIQKEDNVGKIQNGPGGPLYDFLHQHPQGVLLINFDNFSSQEIARFNTLLDVIRKADGTLIPPEIKIIGLTNSNNPEAYSGADFRSRFGEDGINDCPLENDAFALPNLIHSNLDSQRSEAEINLYGGSDWEERLLGRWVMIDKALHFEEGELITALRKQPNQLVLKNAPWDDPDFVRFWQEARLSTKEIRFKGVHFPLPEGFVWPNLVRQNAHDFASAKQWLHLNPNADVPLDAVVLNPGTLSRFFGVYLKNPNAPTIAYHPGLLYTQDKSKPLRVYLSESLNLNDWDLLLATCAKEHCNIELSCAPGVTLPNELEIKPPEPVAMEQVNFSARDSLHTMYINSSDPDVTIHSLAQEDKNLLVIDASECTSTQLIYNLDGRFDQKNLAFSFSEQEGLLVKALNENQRVVLKGPFSQELIYALHELILQRRVTKGPSQLILIDSEKQVFPEVPNRYHKITALEKKNALKNSGFFTDEQLEQTSLAQLKTQLRYRSWNPKESTHKAWQGYYEVPERPEYKEINLQDAKQIVRQFNQQRIDAVDQVLADSPFVFLAGITGVGKTTFIHEIWKQKHPSVYIGEEQFAAWAAQKESDNDDEFISLFLDEATMANRQWSELEGLFQDPPWIRQDNQILYLTKKHRVILASNPLLYGGERGMPSFLQRHGNSVVFQPMPPEYLYQNLLQPIFSGTALDKEDNYLAILAIDRYLNNLNKDKLLISPRELSMMALLTRSYCDRHPNEDPQKVVRYYAYKLAQQFVPEAKSQEFDRLFKSSAPTRITENLPKNFTLTANTQEVFDLLSDSLHLRTARKAGRIPATGGLGGLVIEGEAGVGKTELVVKSLLAHGLKQGNIRLKHPKGNVFYVMPVSMSVEDKTKLLLKAFNEGSVVVVDELNSAPMMERLLNDLLMGKDPEGKPAKKPGFMVIGTQNPPSYAGRIRATAALEHRLHKLIVLEPNKKDKLKILTDKGVRPSIAEKMIQEYEGRNASAKIKETNPLSFRDLVNRADVEIKASIAHSKQYIRTEIERLQGLNLSALKIGALKDLLKLFEKPLAAHELKKSLDQWNSKFQEALEQESDVSLGFFRSATQNKTKDVITAVFELIQYKPDTAILNSQNNSTNSTLT